MSATDIILKALNDAGASLSVYITERIVEALTEAGYEIRKKPAPRKSAPAREPFAPNTGDPVLDAFMRAHHNPKWKPRKLDLGIGLPPLRPMKVSESEAAERAWKAECESAAERVRVGESSGAEDALRYLIGLHRNPWRRSRVEYDARGVKRTIYESPRHSGIEIHEVISGRWSENRDYLILRYGVQVGIEYLRFSAAQEMAEFLQSTVETI